MEASYNYYTYDRQVSFSSSAQYNVQRSYEDEYEWYVEMCEEYDLEPEQYED